MEGTSAIRNPSQTGIGGNNDVCQRPVPWGECPKPAEDIDLERLACLTTANDECKDFYKDSMQNPNIDKPAVISLIPSFYRGRDHFY